MSRAVNNLLIGIIAIEVITILIPTTILYLFGQVWSIYLTIVTLHTGSPPHNSNLVLFASILLIFGYALFSLWWLVFRFRFKTINEIPKAVWLGIALGTIALLGYAVSTCFITSANPIPIADYFKTKAIFSSGPLILLITLFITMWYREKNPPNTPLSTDAPTSGAPVS